jgi:mannose-6-phosphate isomerase-like protein (cupin superfamily)
MAMSEPALTAFRYERPETDKPKKIIWLAKTDRLFATIQVINRGGETNLHAHAHLDGFWFVMKGRGRFYSNATTVACELGPQEGVLVPRGAKYWFESVGPEPLEILQVECSDIAMKTHEQLMSDRKDFTPPVRAGAEHAEATKL